MIRRLVLMLVLALLAIPYMGSASAVETGAAGKLEQALSKLTKSGGFSCQFRQVVYFAEGGEQHYTGKLAIKRPGRFLWQYSTPYEQLYISSGDLIWHYEADLMQAERMRSLDMVDPVAMKLLDGRIGIKDIKLLATEKLRFGGVSYRIQIGQGPELLLAFSVADDLRWLESEDMLGNRNRMILSSVNREIPSEASFQFVPPQGVEVIDVSGYESNQQPEVIKVQ